MYIETQKRYFDDSPHKKPRHVIAARSTDSELRIKRIDDIIDIRKTNDPQLPYETIIGFSNPAAGLNADYIGHIFDSDMGIDEKLKILNDQISRVRPSTNFSLDEGVIRQDGIIFSQKINIETGQYTAPQIFLTPVLNKQKMTYSQVGKLVGSQLEDRDTKNQKELLRVALFWEAKRLYPYSFVFYDRQSEQVIADNFVVSSLTEPASPGHKIVKELTIKASETAAIFAYWNKVPMIFKGTNDNQKNYRPIYGVQPVVHRHYNLTAYLNISRQLRSVIDKINGLQLTQFINFYGTKALPFNFNSMTEIVRSFQN